MNSPAAASCDQSLVYCRRDEDRVVHQAVVFNTRIFVGRSTEEEEELVRRTTTTRRLVVCNKQSMMVSSNHEEKRQQSLLDIIQEALRIVNTPDESDELFFSGNKNDDFHDDQGSDPSPKQ